MDWNCHYIHPWSGVSYSKLLVLRLDSNLRIVLEANRALTRLEPSWSRDCVGVLKWFCLIFKQNTLVYLRKSPDDFIHLRMATPLADTHLYSPPPISEFFTLTHSHPCFQSSPYPGVRISEYFRFFRIFEVWKGHFLGHCKNAENIFHPPPPINLTVAQLYQTKLNYLMCPLMTSGM